MTTASSTSARGSSATRRSPSIAPADGEAECDLGHNDCRELRRCRRRKAAAGHGRDRKAQGHQDRRVVYRALALEHHDQMPWQA